MGDETTKVTVVETQDKPKKKRNRKSLADLRAKYSNIAATLPNGEPQTVVGFDDEHDKQYVWINCAGCGEHTKKYTSDLFQSFFCKTCKKPSGKTLAKSKQIENLKQLVRNLEPDKDADTESLIDQATTR